MTDKSPESAKLSSKNSKGLEVGAAGALVAASLLSVENAHAAGGVFDVILELQQQKTYFHEHRAESEEWRSRAVVLLDRMEALNPKNTLSVAGSTESEEQREEIRTASERMLDFYLNGGSPGGVAPEVVKQRLDWLTAEGFERAEKKGWDWNVREALGKRYAELGTPWRQKSD
jgi:hypothetical protein